MNKSLALIAASAAFVLVACSGADVDAGHKPSERYTAPPREPVVIKGEKPHPKAYRCERMYGGVLRSGWCVR